MEKQDILAGGAEETATATGTATATATQAAPGAGMQLCVTGFSISCGVAPTAAGTYQIRRAAGATVMRAGLLPVTAQIAPLVYEFKRVLVCGENESADIIVAGWTTATLRVELYTVTRPFAGTKLTPAAA